MRIAPAEGERLFSPESDIWRLTREHTLLLGGASAAILQIADEEVARGVSAHSNFRGDSLGRLVRTLDAVYGIVFGDLRQAQKIAHAIAAIHAKVRGPGYSASSARAQMWVLATLIGVGVGVYRRFVDARGPRDPDRYYRDMRIFGTHFGLNLDYGPQSWQAFGEYYAEQLASPTLGASALSAQLAAHIARPRAPWWMRIAWPLSSFLAAEFLPVHVACRLGLQPYRSHLGSAILDSVLPRLIPHLPSALRFVPASHLPSQTA